VNEFVRFPLATFWLDDMIECRKQLQMAASPSSSMEETAAALTRFFYETLVGPDGAPACALVRFYKTHPLGELPVELQAFARSVMEEEAPTAATKCLTLLGTAGDLHAWNDRRKSRSHKAIPLPSPEMVSRLPMVSQLINQFGLEMSDLLEAHPELIIDLERKEYNVFFVPNAHGSPHIPAQDFVHRYNIESVLGFGGVLPSGELYAVILFSKVRLSEEVARLFRTLSLTVKLAVMPFEKTVFGPPC
jgi:hypothetical protein